MDSTSFGLLYFDVRNYIEVVVWPTGVVVLYKTPRQLAGLLALSLALTIALAIILS